MVALPIGLAAQAGGRIPFSAQKSVLTPEMEQRMLAHTPAKRLGTPDDIAGAILYFAAPVSAWVSGQTLFVNGGGVQTLDRADPPFRS